uniref:Protein stand still n=1 Tax=Glossina brevipalpis TaxID=37001 RepID=A0A1A9WNW1_9MUSC
MRLAYKRHSIFESRAGGNKYKMEDIDSNVIENSSLNISENQNYDNANLPTNESFNCSIDQSRHYHIPYILNGELYQIQTQEGENVTVKCCNCPSDRVYRGSVRSTGNFHMHIKRRHPDLLGKLHNMKVNALLERRDRLMRNRKFGNPRPHRNTSTPVRSFKSEPISQTRDDVQLMPTASSSRELSLMHTHKLKIKTVFRRHQLESNGMRQECNKGKYLKVSNNECFDEDVPLDYSFKTAKQNEVNLEEEQQQQQQQIAFTTSAQNHMELPTTHNTQQAVDSDNGGRSYDHENVSTVSPVINYVKSCNFSNGIVIDNERNYHMSNIKPEHFSTGEEAANPTTLPDSAACFSTQTTSTESYNSLQGDIPGTSGTETGNRDNNYWADIILRIEKFLKEIQSEMNVRNQIETNRIYLDIAKFKFLHPDFRYNW